MTISGTLPASSHSFASIEQLDEVVHDLGWSTEYRQLEAGSFSSTFTTLEGDSWFFIEEQSSRDVEVGAPAPPGMFVLALVEGDAAVVNGQTLSSDHLFVQSPDSELRVTLPAGIKVTQIGIVAEQFEDAIQTIAPDLTIPRASANTISIAPGSLANIRRLMRSTLSAPSKRKATQEEMVSRILTDIVTVAADHGNAPIDRDLHRAAARRALDRAMDYIEAHLCEAIRVESICRYAGATLRSLQRIFARELGMSPKQYVKARRLNAIRRHFLAMDGEQSLRVTDVAQSYSYTHMGRFAGDYHRHFGEYPRETLLSR